MGDLDVVAEDFVEADLQRLDSGPAPLRCLERTDPFAGAARRFGDPIQLGVKPRTNGAAFAHQGRRVIDQGSGQLVSELWRRADLAAQLASGQRVTCHERFLQRGNGIEGAPKGDQLSSGCVPLRGA